MRKNIHLTHVLFYFDGPQVIEGRDSIGGHYVAVLTGNQNSINEYLVVGTNPDLLRQFKIGTIDLRDLVIKCGQEGWFIGEDTVNEPMKLNLETQNGPIDSYALLPSEGFHLHNREPEGSCLKQARIQNNLVIEISSEPPEATFAHRIAAQTLSGLLALFQRLINHAHAGRKSTPYDSSRTNNLSSLDVIVPAAAGSFKVVLEPNYPLDLLGQSELSYAINLVGATLGKCSDYNQTLEAIKAHKGHFAKAYIDLLGFIAQHDTSFRMSWAEPKFSAEMSKTITNPEAKALHIELSKNSDLSNQVVEFEGQLIKANTQKKTWGIKTEEGKILSGKCASGSPSLSGLTLEAEYRFKCTETITLNPATGKEQSFLVLIEYEVI